MLGLAGVLLCLAWPAFPAGAQDSRILQVWPDRGIGVASGLLEGATAHAETQVLPFGVCRTSSGDVVRARTYLRFPLDVFPPGTEILRTTLYVYTDGGSNVGEAAFGAYRVLEPWEEDGWSDDPATWPILLAVPIASTVASFDVVTPTPPPPTPVPTTALTVTATPTLTATETSALFSKPAGHGLVQVAAATTVTVTLDPLDSEVTVGATTTVDIRIENVTDLYSADVCLTFDSDLLEVVDAEPSTEDVVEIQAGTFLGLDAMVEDNIVYQGQDDGEIYFYQTTGDGPVSGSGVLASITFRGKEVGSSELGCDGDYVDLEDYDGGAITAELEDGSVTVTSEESATQTPGPSPTSTPTSTPGPSPTPTSTSTPGPSPTPTSLTSPLVTPTPGPTSTPTPRPPTSTPGPTPTSPASPSPTPTSLPSSAPVVSLRQGAGTWLVWDVTALMRAWQAREIHNYGLALAPAPDPDADPETTGDLLVARWLAADDHDTRPYLIVEFDVHPVTPEPVLPPAGSPAGWGGAGVLLIGAALLILGLAMRRGSRCA